MHLVRRVSGGAALGLALVLGLGLAAAGAAAAGPTFEAQGRVTALDPARNVVTLEHGGIAGLLPAGRSEFPVSSAGLLHGVRPGDLVRFTLAAADESHGLLTVTTLLPDAPSRGGWPDRVVAGAAAILSLLALAATVGVGLALWRTVQALHRRVVALDHEAGMLRGTVADTEDAVRQIARALEEATTILRVGYVRELRQRVAAASPGAAATRGPAELASTLVVVRRGQGELYHAVESGAVGPGCTVIWDRRRGERRTAGRHPVSHERRRAERRASPGETWTRLGFHLVPGGQVDAPRPVVRSLRSAGGERGPAR